MRHVSGRRSMGWIRSAERERVYGFAYWHLSDDLVMPNGGLLTREEQTPCGRRRDGRS